MSNLPCCTDREVFMKDIGIKPPHVYILRDKERRYSNSYCIKGKCLCQPA